MSFSPPPGPSPPSRDPGVRPTVTLTSSGLRTGEGVITSVETGARRISIDPDGGGKGSGPELQEG